MTASDAPLIVLLVVLFLIAVVIAAGEAALLRTPHIRALHLAAEGRRGARRLVSLTERLPTVLNAVLLTALLSQIGAATVTGILSERWFGSVGVTIASIVLTVVLFIYAEAIPKTFAVRNADRTALALSGPLSALELVLRPVVAVLVWIADIQIPGKGVTTSPTVTEGELRLLANRAASEGEITDDDLALIERAFRIGDLRTDDVMVPRTEIVSVADESTVDAALEVAVESGHRRLPVHRGDLEEIVGVVRLRDLVGVPPERRTIEVGVLTEEPLVVPESKRVLDLLEDMQASGAHLAIVVDEYGGTAGLVTIEDIVEELIGSVSDDPSTADVVELPEGGWSVDGKLPVEDLEELLGVELPRGGWNTVGGLVMARAGRILSAGEAVEVAGHELRVMTVRGRRVARVAVGPRGSSPVE